MSLVAFKSRKEFPISGPHLREVLENLATIFYLAIYKPKEYEKWINLPINHIIKENLDKLLEWSGINELISEKENNTEIEDSD